MKSELENQKYPDDGTGNNALPLAFKWMNIRKGVYRFRTHEDADDWWKEHFLSAYRRANNAHSPDLAPLRELLTSQGITPPE